MTGERQETQYELRADPHAIPKPKNEFNRDGIPLTGTDGKRLTPAEMFIPGDVIAITVGKSHPRQDAGLRVMGRQGKYYVRKVPTGGLFSRTPVRESDKILELNGLVADDFENVNLMKKMLKYEPVITIVVLRKDPDASESDESSAAGEYEVIQPDGRLQGGEQSRPASNDDNSYTFDGHLCNTVWCPKCS